MLRISFSFRFKIVAEKVLSNFSFAGYLSRVLMTTATHNLHYQDNKYTIFIVTLKRRVVFIAISISRITETVISVFL